MTLDLGVKDIDMSEGSDDVSNMSEESDDVNINKDHSLRSSGWAMTSVIIVGNSVGTGVLSLSRALAQLGWGPGLVCLGLAGPFFWLAGYYVMQTHLYIDGKGESARTYGDFAGVLAGPVARKYGYGLVYTLAFMVTGGYMLTLANSIQQIFYDVHLCLPVASLAAFALVLPGTQLRTLHLIAPHAMVSFVALLVVIAICLYFLLSDSASCDYEPPRSLNFWGAFNSVGSFVWSYSGVSYYPEMLAEMKRPQDFARKSLGFAIVAMTGLYALVSITTYATCGDGTPPSIVLVIPKGPWLRIASIFMVYHIIVAYLINSQVLIRGIVTACGWDKALEPGFQGRARWFAISTVFTALAYLIADVIPQFDNLNDLTGNVCCTQGCLILPPLFFFLVQRVAPWPDSACKTALTILGWPMIVSGIFLFFAGTTGSIMTIWQDAHADDSRRPFACQALS